MHIHISVYMCIHTCLNAANLDIYFKKVKAAKINHRQLQVVSLDDGTKGGRGRRMKQMHVTSSLSYEWELLILLM